MIERIVDGCLNIIQLFNFSSMAFALFLLFIVVYRRLSFIVYRLL